MTRASELRALAECVEQAAGADREIDLWVAEAIGALPPKTTLGTALHKTPAYTASLDAAVSLVPAGWGVSVDATSPKDGIAVNIMRYIGKGQMQEAKSDVVGEHAEARARIAAALRALAEEAGDD